MTINYNISEYVAPKIFVSYSWTSDEYAAWIIKLAERLIHDGVEVILDRWDLKPGQDKYAFMESMVTNEEIDKVLIMCDKRYAEKANRREGGVGTESLIISQEVYSSVGQEKFIPVITEKNEDGSIHLPTFVKSRIYIDLSDITLYEKGYEELLRTITDRPALLKPQLGRPPAYLFESNRSTPPSTFALRAFEDAITSSRLTATGLAHDYIEKLSTEIANICASNEDSSEKSEKDVKVLEYLASWDYFRIEWHTFIKLLGRYGTDERLFELIPIFFDSTLKLTTNDSGFEDKYNQHITYIIHEAFLYAIALLLKEQRFEAIAMLLAYQYQTNHYKSESARYGVFYPYDKKYLESLLIAKWNEEDSSDQRYEYALQQWLLRRANNDVVSFASLKEADLVLWLRYLLEEDPNSYLSSFFWYPITLGDMQRLYRREDTLPIFRRAASLNYFNKIKCVLGIQDKEDFMRRWERAFSQGSSMEASWKKSYCERTFNVDKIATII